MPNIRWDDHMVAKLQENPEYASGYLNACLEEDLDAFKVGLKQVIDARGGASKVARQAGISRESVYKSYRVGGNPTLKSLSALLATLGLKLSVDHRPDHPTSDFTGVRIRKSGRRKDPKASFPILPPKVAG